VLSRELPNSGRSAKNIIRLANHLIEWVQQSHPAEELRNALVRPLIQPTDLNDPQPNPLDRPNNVYIDTRRCNSEDEIKKVCRNVKNWLANHSDETAAILVTSNKRGSDIADSLREMGVEPVELLRVSRSTRKTAEFLSFCLKFLNKPSKRLLSEIIALYYRFHTPEDQQDDAITEVLSRAILKIDPMECYLSPTPVQNWRKSLTGSPLPDSAVTLLEQFQLCMERWMGATLLPIDQLILTISQDVFTEACDLALAHKVAAMLERASRSYPDWDLGNFAEELESVSKNQSKIADSVTKTWDLTPICIKAGCWSQPFIKPKGWNGIGYTCSLPTTTISHRFNHTTNISRKNGLFVTVSIYQPKPLKACSVLQMETRWHFSPNPVKRRWKPAANTALSACAYCSWALPAPAVNW
jgi:hypothetical protein